MRVWWSFYYGAINEKALCAPTKSEPTAWDGELSKAISSTHGKRHNQKRVGCSVTWRRVGSYIRQHAQTVVKRALFGRETYVTDVIEFSVERHSTGSALSSASDGLRLDPSPAHGCMYHILSSLARRTAHRSLGNDTRIGKATLPFLSNTYLGVHNAYFRDSLLSKPFADYYLLWPNTRPSIIHSTTCVAFLLTYPAPPPP